MNFSSAARLASMVTDRKRGSTRRNTADRSANTAASRTCEEFWFWSRWRTPPVPELRIHRRRRSELATRSMTGEWAAARALHFLHYFLVYRRQSRGSSLVGPNITGSWAELGNLWAGPSADVDKLLMEGLARSQLPYWYHPDLCLPF